MHYQTMKRFGLAALCAALCTTTAASESRADDEASQVAYVVVAPYGRYYFKMVPDPKARYDRTKGRGMAYAVSESGADKLMWKTSGWYASRTAIAHGGRYLVRLGNWPRGRAPSHKHLGIAFYDRGKLIKKYSTKDLLRGAKKIDRSVSHYQFLGKVIGFVKQSNHKFAIRLVTGATKTFDVRTGKLL